jgi:serine/threonine protein phosphatase PrpC
MSVADQGGSAGMQAVLWGRNHVAYDEVAVRSVSPDAAVAITRGRFPKAYQWVDPNEDSAAAVVGTEATLLVVADGHNGVEAAEIAVSYVLGALGDVPPPANLSDGQLVDLFLSASQRVMRETRRLALPKRESRTTLTIALVAPQRVQWAGMGDTALFVADGRAARDLSRPRHHFVGYQASRREVDERLWRGVRPLTAGSWVVLTTDGFTNFTSMSPAMVVADIVRRADDACDIARAIVEHAGTGGAGDNVAVAVAAAPARGRSTPEAGRAGRLAPSPARGRV